MKIFVTGASGFIGGAIARQRAQDHPKRLLEAHGVTHYGAGATA